MNKPRLNLASQAVEQADTVPAVFNNPMTAEDESRLAQSYELSLPAMRALDGTKLLVIKIPPLSVVTTVLGAKPKMDALRDQMVALPGFNAQAYDQMAQHAQALGYAEVRYQMVTKDASKLRQCGDETYEFRDKFRADADALIKNNLVDGSPLKACRHLVGYRNAAFDVQIYVRFFMDRLPDIDGKCAITRDVLKRADQVSAFLLRQVGLRDQGPEVICEAAEMRQRAFTLVVQTYDQSRRAVSFLRWQEGDADDIAPSLYASTRKRRRTDKQDDATGDETRSESSNDSSNAQPDSPPALPAANPTKPSNGDGNP